MRRFSSCTLRLLQAYDVARSGLAHEPVNSKAWVRLGDACREAGRWQLAALSYKAALELGSAGDADVKVRRLACHI
jgi:cytochrome c-type biogenesis protein CcmH/NrfG